MPHSPVAHGTHLGWRAEGPPIAARTIRTSLLPFPSNSVRKSFLLESGKPGNVSFSVVQDLGKPRLSWGSPGAHWGRGEGGLHSQSWFMLRSSILESRKEVASRQWTEFISTYPSESLCWVVCRGICKDDPFLAMLTPTFIQLLLFSSILLTCTSKRH